MSKDDFNKHFSPPYNPWDQRFCVAPGGDFFQCIRDGTATIVTDHIDHFTPDGIQMKNGQHIEADFIISATGMNLQNNFPFSTIKASIDGMVYKASDHIMYNGVMMSDVPNFGYIMGYTNASWTLKADIASLYFTKLLNYMKNYNVSKVVPREGDDVKHENFTGGLSSGYINRARGVVPKQGDKYPWSGGVNYIIDLFQMTFRGLSKDSLEFTYKKDI